VTEIGPVCVVGNLTTDLLLRGVANLPRWGQEVQGRAHEARPAGQGAYLALGLARLGVETRLVGLVGADAEGRAIHGALASAGVGVEALEVSEQLPTAITVALVRPDGERAFASDFACQRDIGAEFVARHTSLVRASRAVCLVGLFNLPSFGPAVAVDLFATARAAGVLTVLDTGWDPEGWQPATVAAMRALLAYTDVFLPNLEEATALTGLVEPAAAATELARAGARVVVVKCGAAGSTGYCEGRLGRFAALPVVAIDAVGAGDCFDAAFLHAHLRGLALAECLAFANAAAALYVSRSSGRHPTVAEIHDVLVPPTPGAR
jgi:sugar/nucleoside kinase (ribokinase family)